VTTGMKFVAEGLGLPKEANFDGSYVYDDLVIEFKVTFPDTLSISEMSIVKEAFGDQLDHSIEDYVDETCQLIPFKSDHYSTVPDDDDEFDNDSHDDDSSP